MIAEESSFLCVLLEAVGKGQDQATDIDIDFQKVNQYHLWNTEKQDRVSDAKDSGKLGLKTIFCNREKKRW